MTQTIEQIEAQIVELQKNLEALKNPKLEVSRQFTGQYFTPYKGIQYRRMESEGIPIWEFVSGKEWVQLDKKQSEDLEKIYLTDCISQSKK